jgi:hypothetical protein
MNPPDVMQREAAPVLDNDLSADRRSAQIQDLPNPFTGLNRKARRALMSEMKSDYRKRFKVKL